MKYIFTSINNAYMPKAITLADSLRRVYGKDVHVTCMLSDARRDDIDYSAFDEVLTIDELDLPVASVEAWIFKHTVVELSTAVKPWAFKKIFERHGADAVLYMDPDTVAYSPLDEIYAVLPENPIVLTPHVTVPATTEEALLDGEMLGCLRHGVFNLGFLALAGHGEGPAFLDWWADRCLNWCYDDASRGLFTDQRWIDLAPCFFSSIHVLRHAGYNVATWNLYYRRLAKIEDGQIVVNDTFPLRFFHYSGFDLGTYEFMLNKHAPGHALLREMTDWYVKEQVANGQRRLGRQPGAYDFFSDGERIKREWRVTYREAADLMSTFPNPYSEPGFRDWVQRRPHLTQSEGLTRFEPRNGVVRFVVDRVRRRPRLIFWLKRVLPEEFISGLKRRL